MSKATHTRRLARPSDSTSVAIIVDGETAQAYPGETVATVLLALGRLAFRHTDRLHAPRGPFCGMGVCYDCLVTVDGQPNVRACMTIVRTGMVIQTGGPGDA